MLLPIDHRSKRPSTGAIRRAMKPTFFSSFSFSFQFGVWSLPFLFRFGRCFVFFSVPFSFLGLFVRFRYKALPPVAAVAGHSLVYNN